MSVKITKESFDFSDDEGDEEQVIRITPTRPERVSLEEKPTEKKSSSDVKYFDIIGSSSNEEEEQVATIKIPSPAPHIRHDENDTPAKPIIFDNSSRPVLPHLGVDGSRKSQSHHLSLSSPAGPAPPPSSSSASAAPTKIITKLPVIPVPFGIVLVNIRKAAEDRHIHCINRVLDDQMPPYVALSYRWGELDEQMVPATKDYNARITSFQLQDFFKLCQAMLHEPDLQHIDYVWVDAICVNQDNMEIRKATIYRMNDIYIYATAIVAVPDLNAFHLSTTSAANCDAMAVVKRYRRYLYYLLVGTPEAQQQLVEMDHACMDKLGVPPVDLHRRELGLTCLQQHQQRRNGSTSSSTSTSTSTSTSNSTSNSKKKKKNQKNPGTPGSSSGGDDGFMQQLMTLMLTSSSSMAPAADVDPHAKAEHYQKLSCRMMIEFQRYEWQQKLDQRKNDIIRSMQFLQLIMEDWSNRTWVISEYHIAKRKSGKLKFWYNQLSSRELHGLRFFEFDFEKQQRQALEVNTLRHQHPYTNQIIYLSRKFKGSMRRRLTKRSVLEMMLQTKASRNEDRFHSIIPLVSKYKHHIKNRDSISSMEISDMLSVRLKLMEWVDIKDRLNLLYGLRQPLASTLPLLPTFATLLKTIKPGLSKLLLQVPRCNFDLNDDDGIRLVRGCGIDGGDKLDVFLLRPRVYYARCSRKSTSVDRQFYQEIGGKTNKLWQDLGLDPDNDPLEAISIPLFIVDDDDDTMNTTNDAATKGLLTSDIQLVGSWTKNSWILYPFCSNYKDGKIYPSRRCNMDDDHPFPFTFRIY